MLDLGLMPPSDALLTREALAQPEPRYPLEVGFCPRCTLVQLLETLPPEQLFGERYLYFSSFSDELLAHARATAAQLIDARRLGPTSLVVEVASNDGYLLRHFVAAGIPALGVDPAPAPARAARAIGVPTLQTFFGRELAARLAAEGKRADVVICNNVLAHVADTNGFVQGIATLLKEDGTASIEVPYVRDLIEQCEFDTIYHEHLCYFSALALDRLLRRHGLYLNRVERLPIHGGSLRLHAGRRDQADASVTALLAEERALGMDRPMYFRDFATRVGAIRKRMRGLLDALRRRGKRIAGYGAAAKGTILVNAIGVGPETIEFVVDRNVHKQGKFMPGVRIPILEPGELLRRRPDYAVLLPWNFKDEILQQQAEYRAGGGKFIIPIPWPVIV